MSRGLAENMKSHIGSSSLYVALFADFDFGELGVTRFWTGFTNINWNDNVYVGGGHMVGVHTSGETEELSSKSMTFILNGVDQSFYSLALIHRLPTSACQIIFEFPQRRF
jgi:hypothetical protein